MIAARYGKITYGSALIGLALLVTGLIIYIIMSPGNLLCAFTNTFRGADFIKCLSNGLGNAVLWAGVVVLASATLIGMLVNAVLAVARRDIILLILSIILFIMMVSAAAGYIKIH